MWQNCRILDSSSSSLAESNSLKKAACHRGEGDGGRRGDDNANDGRGEASASGRGEEPEAKTPVSALDSSALNASEGFLASPSALLGPLGEGGAGTGGKLSNRRTVTNRLDELEVKVHGDILAKISVGTDEGQEDGGGKM